MDQQTACIKIGSRTIGAGHPCFVIAEAGVNHNGDLLLARQLVDIAAESGADAVKFQTFKADRLVSPIAPKAAYQLKTTDTAESQLAMLARLELKPEYHEELQAYCRNRGILFLSTPFDEESADLLERLGVPAFKIPSGEVTNWPLLRHVARKGKPVILSTGMSRLAEVDDAVRVMQESDAIQIAVLHCLTNYPANPEHANLRAMVTMRRALGVPVGYSDHTPGSEVALAAVALGACIIEKHFTLDQDLPGPDHQASLNPAELGALVRGIRTVESALGDGRKVPAPSEQDNRAIVRRSLMAARGLEAGSSLTMDMLRALRPAGGIPPTFAELLVGRRLRRAVAPGEMFKWSDLE